MQRMDDVGSMLAHDTQPNHSSHGCPFNQGHDHPPAGFKAAKVWSRPVVLGVGSGAVFGWQVRVPEKLATSTPQTWWAARWEGLSLQAPEVPRISGAVAWFLTIFKLGLSGPVRRGGSSASAPRVGRGRAPRGLGFDAARVIEAAAATTRAYDF